jgi:hypothetical protein
MSTPIYVTADKGIAKIVIKEGQGRKPKEGEKVSLVYEGRLKETGEVFDSSQKNGHKFRFDLGKDEVIDGLSLGVASMQMGEHSLFTISPDYGYGEKGREPQIPPNAVLEFDIELVEIRDKFFNAIDAAKRCNQIKDEANAKFKEGKFEEAIWLYRHAYHIITDWVNAESMQLKLVLSRNLAICFGKVKNWNKSLKKAEYVLSKEPGCPRCLLRKAEALLELNRLDDCKQVILVGLGVTKQDPVFLDLQKRLVEAEKKENSRRNEVFAQMFKKE